MYPVVFERLVKEVMEYESDTFSAEDSNVSKLEAIEIVDRFLERWWDHVDGDQIARILDSLRG